MGDEVLEETEMEPFMESITGEISGKRIVLFGSYGWGDGEWMTDWENRVKEHGGVLIEDSIMCNEAPEDDHISLLTSLGEKYATA